MSSSTGESGLTGIIRVNVTPEKRIPKKHKYVKPTALSPFLPGDKILLNEDMVIIVSPKILHYPEKMICHKVVKMILLRKNDKTIKDHDEEYKKETLKMK